MRQGSRNRPPCAGTEKCGRGAAKNLGFTALAKLIPCALVSVGRARLYLPLRASYIYLCSIVVVSNPWLDHRYYPHQDSTGLKNDLIASRHRPCNMPTSAMALVNTPAWRSRPEDVKTSRSTFTRSRRSGFSRDAMSFAHQIPSILLVEIMQEQPRCVSVDRPRRCSCRWGFRMTASLVRKVVGGTKAGVDNEGGGSSGGL